MIGVAVAVLMLALPERGAVIPFWGFAGRPKQLFYDFCLEDHGPDDHVLRRIDRFLAALRS